MIGPMAEHRWPLLPHGLSFRGRLLVVWHTSREDGIRIIGARAATPRERRAYERR